MKDPAEKKSDKFGKLTEDLVKNWHKNRFPDVSQASAEDLSKLIFGKLKVGKDTPGYNLVDITVNVDIIRRVQVLLNERENHE